jgi:hypothetical protein
MQLVSSKSNRKNLTMSAVISAFHLLWMLRKRERSVVLQSSNLVVSFPSQDLPKRVQNSFREQLSHESDAEYL